MDTLDEIFETAQSIDEEMADNPLIMYEHLPGPGGRIPGPQEQFHGCTSKIKGLLGGNRSGKTEEGAEYFITEALNLPNGRGWCACPSNEMSIQIQQRKIWKLLPKKSIKYGHYDSVNGFRHNTVVLKNGFVIIFKAYEQGVEKFQSDDVDLIWLDEEPPYSVYQECLLRIADRAGQLFFTLTPIQGFTKFVDEVILKKRTDGGSTIQIYTINTEDNVVLPQDQLKMLIGEINEDDKPARLHGIPVNKEGLVYPGWKDQSPWVVSIDMWNKVKDTTTRYTSIDPHNRTPSAVGFYGVDRDGRFWLFDEIFDRLFVKELAQAIVAKEGDAPSEWRTIDSSAQEGNHIDGRSLRMTLMEYGVDTVLAKKDHKNQSSIALMRQMLRLGDDGALPMFVVVENCTRARYEFSRYSWSSWDSEKTESKRDAKQEVRKKDDHIMDCNHYIIRSHAGFSGDDRGADNFVPENAPTGAYEIVQKIKEYESRPVSPFMRYKVA